MTLPLSVNLMPKGPVAEVADLAVLAERLGYRRCWVYDEGLITRDVYVTLTAIALATKRILLGPGITNPCVRHPGVAAAVTPGWRTYGLVIPGPSRIRSVANAMAVRVT